MSTTVTPTVRRAPRWLPLLLVAVGGAAAMIVTLAVIDAVTDEGDPGQDYLTALHTAAPAGVTIDDPVVLAAATKACEAGDAGTLQLQQGLTTLNFAPAAIVNSIMPAHAAYCASL